MLYLKCDFFLLIDISTVQTKQSNIPRQSDIGTQWYIFIGSDREKSNIAIADQYDSIKIISHFWCTDNVFANNNLTPSKGQPNNALSYES